MAYCPTPKAGRLVGEFTVTRLGAKASASRGDDDGENQLKKRDRTFIYAAATKRRISSIENIFHICSSDDEDDDKDRNSCDAALCAFDEERRAPLSFTTAREWHCVCGTAAACLGRRTGREHK